MMQVPYLLWEGEFCGKRWRAVRTSDSDVITEHTTTNDAMGQPVWIRESNIFFLQLAFCKYIDNECERWVDLEVELQDQLLQDQLLDEDK